MNVQYTLKVYKCAKNQSQIEKLLDAQHCAPCQVFAVHV